MLRERNQHKRAIVRFHLYKIKKKIVLMYSGQSQKRGFLCWGSLSKGSGLLSGAVPTSSTSWWVNRYVQRGKMYRAATGFAYFPMYVIVHHKFIN